MRRGVVLIAAIAVVLLSAADARGDAACDRMRGWLAQGGSASGLIVVEAESGDVVCASAPGTQRILASNMKLFTTATALARLGPSTRIPTELLGDGRLDESGTYRGSLYLKGGGDPALGSPAFYNSFLGGLGTNLFALKAQVRAAGIKAITGRLYADATIFDRRRGVADSGYGTSPYIGPLSGLAFNSGFSSTSAGSFASDPAKLAASKLARSLRAAGVRMPTRVALAKAPTGAERIGVVRSPTITRIADNINVFSNNFFAETVLKLIGARLGGAGTTAAGARVVSAFASSLGSGVNAADGSGLTRSNRASPRQVADLLLAMRNEEVGEEFVEDLALAGQEGTVEDRMEGTAAYGRCRTKTGTLTGVSSLSGYCFNAGGRVMAFSILMNGVGSLSLAHLNQDRIAATVAGY